MSDRTDHRTDHRTERVVVTSEHPTHERAHLARRVSWGAVFAGALVALMTTLLLTLLALGFGLQAIDPASESAPLAGFGTGTGVVTIVINLVALFLGGYVAGRLAASARRGAAALHGVLAWGVLTLGAFYLVTSAVGGLVSGTANLVSNTVQGVTNVAPDVAQGISSAVDAVDVPAVEQRVDAFLQEVGASDLEAAGAEVAQIVTGRLAAGDDLTAEAAQEELRGALERYTDLSAAQVAERAQAFAQDLEAAGQQLVRRAERAAGAAAETAGSGALWAFVALLVGAAVAAWGAVAGAPTASARREAEAY